MLGLCSPVLGVQTLDGDEQAGRLAGRAPQLNIYGGEGAAPPRELTGMRRGPRLVPSCNQGWDPREGV